MKRRLLAGVSAAAALLFSAAPAHADPITAAVVTFGAALSGSLGVASFITANAFLIGAQLGISKLFGPKGLKASSAQQRQADALALSIGEVAREVIFGRAATGGSLVDCCNYGGPNGTDWNLFCIAIADHECEGIEGFYVNDQYVPWHGGGEVPGFNGQLHVHWRPGRADDAPWPDDVGTDSWADLLPCLAAGAGKGVAKIAFAYKADAPDAENPVWSGRPQMLWVVKGAKVYDPRKDDTVQGGAGALRWADPSTWEWSENAELCRYAYDRGVYALGQVDQPGMLLVGRGLSELEAPPARTFAAANLCDELVEAADGEMEPRYRVGGVIRSSDTFLDVARMFADATAGDIVQPEGGVAVDPGQAKAPVFFFSDDDLVIGEAVRYRPFKSVSDRVNTVAARYVEPTQKWADHAAPLSRDMDAVIAEGPHELTLSLSLVTSRSQAQRIADIRLRQARKEMSAGVTLGPDFAHVEEGDWGVWTSKRRFNGESRIVRVTAYSLNEAWRNSLALEETAFEVYGFGGAKPTTATPFEPDGPPDALKLFDVNIFAIQKEGEPAAGEPHGPLIPAVRAEWRTPVDPAINTVRIEVRAGADQPISPTSTTNVNAGELDATNGVAANATLQARLVPLGSPGRPIIPSPWVTLSTSDLYASNTLMVGDRTADQVNAAIAAAQDAAEATQAGVDAINQTLDARFQTVDDRIDSLDLDDDGFSPLAIMQQALAGADRALVADARTRAPDGELIREVVQDHVEQLEDHTIRFSAIVRKRANGFGYVFDMDAVADESGKTVSKRVSEIAAGVGDDVLASVGQTYVSEATLSGALGYAGLSVTAAMANYKASVSQTFVASTDLKSALGYSNLTVSAAFSQFKADAADIAKAYSDAGGSATSLTRQAKAQAGEATTAANNALEAVADASGKLAARATLGVDVNGVATGVEVVGSFDPDAPTPNQSFNAITLRTDRLLVLAPGQSASDAAQLVSWTSGTGFYSPTLTVLTANIKTANIITAHIQGGGVVGMSRLDINPGSYILNTDVFMPGGTPAFLYDNLSKVQIDVFLEIGTDVNTVDNTVVMECFRSYASQGPSFALKVDSTAFSVQTVINGRQVSVPFFDELSPAGGGAMVYYLRFRSLDAPADKNGGLVQRAKVRVSTFYR